jgi:hypothetical protein
MAEKLNCPTQPLSRAVNVAEVTTPLLSVTGDSDTESTTVTRESHGHESTKSHDFMEQDSCTGIE